MIQTYLPDEAMYPELYSLVKTYQVHKHSKYCRKYKHVSCRYGYGKYFTEQTIVARPIDKNLVEEKRVALLNKRQNILLKVKTYIDEYLNPSKPDFRGHLSIEMILRSLDIYQNEYYEALSVSSTDDYEIHMKRSTDSCFVNNYNPTILKAWQANMDLQPVFNYYKAVSYMCAYFSKSETETSEALQKASTEIKNLKLGPKEAMYKISAAFSSSTLREENKFGRKEYGIKDCELDL